MADDNQSRTAPYVAFKSFCSAIQSLRTHGLPPTLNRTAWGSRSGAEQSQILNALAFLGLINDKGETQDSLKTLVGFAENSDSERQFWGTLLRSSYDNVFKLDLQNETPKQVEDAIGEYGVAGNVRDRAVRFFLKAALYAKIPLSPRLTMNMRGSDPSASDAEGSADSQGLPKMNGKLPRKKRTARNNPSVTPGPAPQPHANNPSNAMKTIQLPKVGGSFAVVGTFNAFQLMGEERELVYQIIDLMTAYEQKSGQTNG